MHPILVEFGFLNLKIFTYGLLVATGFFAGILLAARWAKQDGLDPQKILDLCFYIAIASLVGARALYIIVEYRYFLANPLEVLKFWKGGLVFYGGLIGGALAFIITTRMRKLDLWQLADIVAPGVALGHALGRLGCFFAGSCYGRPTDVPWAVTYTNPNSLARDVLGVPVHPTQLYSAAFLILLSAILVFIGSRSTFRGQVIASYGILYGTFRFFIEFFRGDPRGAVTLADITLSTSQVVSLLLVPASLGIYLYLKKRGEES